MASLVTYPKFRATVPSTGVPAASYVVRTFAAGTSTPLAVYTDSGLTTPAANPFVLDANGEAVVYAQAGVLYKLQLYDPTNTVQQWSVDNVAFGGGGGTFAQVTAGGGSAISSTVDYIFGASGTNPVVQIDSLTEFNSTTGKLTFKNAGNYLTSCSAILGVSGVTATVANLNLFKNGSVLYQTPIVFGGPLSNVASSPASATLLVSAAVNDVIWWAANITFSAGTPTHQKSAMSFVRIF